MNPSYKKIILLTSSLAGGGAEGMCVNIANSFSKNGWQVELVVLNLNDAVFLNRLSDNINIIKLNANHARYSFIGLLKYIYRKKPKAIFVFSYELSIILVILRIFLRFKVKIIARNVSTLSIRIKQLEKKNFWHNYIIGPLIKFFYGKVDYVVNQCVGMQEDLINLYPQLYKKSSVINNPISEYITNYVNNYNLTKIKKKNYLLCVGRLEKVKAFHYALEGFAGVADKFPNLRLKIVGKGSLENELKKKAFKLSILDRVDFEGFQKNIIPYYLSAEATILTSLYEGYPNALIESISLGTPVVSFDCKSGPNEIIKNNINGYLVRNLDLEDLKNKISKVLVSKFNRKDVIKTVEKNKSQYVFALYEKLAKSMINS